MIFLTFNGSPISVNRMYRGGRRFLTSEGATMKEDFGWQAKVQYRGKLIKEKLEVWLLFTFVDDRRHDIDNCLKATLDCLTGVLWEDDSQIWKLHVEKRVGELASVELQVMQI